MTLEDALAAVQKVRDCPATRRLCLDCWTWAREHGEEAGVSMALMLLDGVRGVVAHEITTLHATAGTGFGTLLGVSEPPASCWVMGWETMKTKDKPRMAFLEPDDPVPLWARYWSEGSKGWHRIPR